MDGPIGRLRSGFRWFEEHYCRVDLRWLGAFRVVLGLVLCGQLLHCWSVARDFYSNDGILPNHFSIFRPLGRGVFSFYHAFSTPTEVHVAFTLTLLVFLAFTVGYRTRLFHVLSFLCITSLDARNLMTENGGTIAVNLLTWWTLLLPLGRRLSIDALLRSLRQRVETSSAQLNQRVKTPEESQAFYSLAVFGLLFQWSAIYFFNVVHKSGEGWRDGSAIHWFLHQDRIITWFGIFAREHAPYWLLRGFAYATLVVEGTLTFLLLVPSNQVWMRRLALLLALGLHGGIAATSRLGPFSYVMVAFFVLPLSTVDWHWLKDHVWRRRGPFTVIYDADCGVCFQICRILQRLDVLERLHFVGNDERDKIPETLSDGLLDQTVAVLTPDGKQLTHERALAAVFTALPFAGLGLGYVLRIPGFRSLVRPMYSAFAVRRHDISARLGLGRCGVDSGKGGGSILALPELEPIRRVWPTAGSGSGVPLPEVLALLFLLITLNQLATDNDWARRRFPRAQQPAPLLAFVDTFRLYQGWRMFAPEPPYEDGRLVVDGRTADGRKVDPFTGEAPDFNPETRVGWGHSQHWCDYHLKMFFARYAANRQHLREYLQRYPLRTENPGDRLVAFDVWWVNDKSPPPGAEHGQPQKPVKILSEGDVKDSGATPWL